MFYDTLPFKSCIMLYMSIQIIIKLKILLRIIATNNASIKKPHIIKLMALTKLISVFSTAKGNKNIQQKIMILLFNRFNILPLG